MELPNLAIRRVVSSLAGAELGDPRRTRRLKRVVSRIARRPQASLPDAMETGAELEGAYRLMNNPHVTMEALHAAHAEATARRARKVRSVLAIHDTTPCQFSHADPETVGYLNTGKAGFYTHYTLVVAAGTRRPLGVSHVEPIIRTRAPSRKKPGKKKRNASGSETRKKKNREFERWGRGIARTSESLSECDVIHVADREIDSYELMATSVRDGHRFVFRVRIRDRKARTPNGENGSLKDLVASTNGVLTREVALATRKARTAPKAARTHAPRKARLATLRFSATRVEIRRPNYLGDEFPAGLV